MIWWSSRLKWFRTEPPTSRLSWIISRERCQPKFLWENICNPNLWWYEYSRRKRTDSSDELLAYFVLNFQIAMEDFSIEFEDYEYWAVPDEIFLDQIHDNLLDLYGSSTYDDETEGGGSGSIAGVVVGSVLAGIFVCVAIGAVIFVSD